MAEREVKQIQDEGPADTQCLESWINRSRHDVLHDPPIHGREFWNVVYRGIDKVVRPQHEISLYYIYMTVLK